MARAAPYLIAAVSVLAPAAAGCSASDGPSGCDCEPGDTELAVEPVVVGLSNPLYLTAPPDDSRLFVVEQAGRVRIVENGQLLEAPFLDISDRVASGGERGLLSIAFHPDYATNGYFYANYTDNGGDTRIERYAVTADPNVADPSSGDSVLYVEQPFGNHNGGLIAFGPDGMLYIGLGDGGDGGDPLNHGQSRGTLLGALLRIDVDGGDPYAVPTDNPFVGDPDGRDEIWAYGLRNPWRFAFDGEAGNLYVADVGQSRWEEINVVPADSGGANYGWNIMEGAHCFASDPCDSSDLALPALEYGHGDGCSVTGGYVYHGSTLAAIRGHYFYSDYCSGFLRSFRYIDGAVSERRQWKVGDLGAVLSFGVDADGELYVLSGGGSVYRLVAAE